MTNETLEQCYFALLERKLLAKKQSNGEVDLKDIQSAIEEVKREMKKTFNQQLKK